MTRNPKAGGRLGRVPPLNSCRSICYKTPRLQGGCEASVWGERFGPRISRPADLRTPSRIGLRARLCVPALNDRPPATQKVHRCRAGARASRRPHTARHHGHRPARAVRLAEIDGLRFRAAWPEGEGWAAGPRAGGYRGRGSRPSAGQSPRCCRPRAGRTGCAPSTARPRRPAARTCGTRRPSARPPRRPPALRAHARRRRRGAEIVLAAYSQRTRARERASERERESEPAR